jgi:hypothetical protein
MACEAGFEVGEERGGKAGPLRHTEVHNGKVTASTNQDPGPQSLYGQLHTFQGHWFERLARLTASAASCSGAALLRSDHILKRAPYLAPSTRPKPRFPPYPRINSIQLRVPKQVCFVAVASGGPSASLMPSGELLALGPPPQPQRRSTQAYSGVDRLPAILAEAYASTASNAPDSEADQQNSLQVICNSKASPSRRGHSARHSSGQQQPTLSDLHSAVMLGLCPACCVACRHRS